MSAVDKSHHFSNIEDLFSSPDGSTRAILAALQTARAGVDNGIVDKTHAEFFDAIINRVRGENPVAAPVAQDHANEEAPHVFTSQSRGR